MNKKPLLLLLFIFLIPLSLSAISIDSQNTATQKEINLKSPTSSFNNNTDSVNSSDFWDNLDTPSDISGSEFWSNHTFEANKTIYETYNSIWSSGGNLSGDGTSGEVGYFNAQNHLVSDARLTHDSVSGETNITQTFDGENNIVLGLYSDGGGFDIMRWLGNGITKIYGDMIPSSNNNTDLGNSSESIRRLYISDFVKAMEVIGTKSVFGDLINGTQVNGTRAKFHTTNMSYLEVKNGDTSKTTTFLQGDSSGGFNNNWILVLKNRNSVPIANIQGSGTEGFSNDYGIFGVNGNTSGTGQIQGDIQWYDASITGSPDKRGSTIRCFNDGNPAQSSCKIITRNGAGAFKDNALSIKYNGYIGISTATPPYPLTVSATNTTEQSISIWAESNVSATGYITRTPETKGYAGNNSRRLPTKNKAIDSSGKLNRAYMLDGEATTQESFRQIGWNHNISYETIAVPIEETSIEELEFQINDLMPNPRKLESYTLRGNNYELKYIINSSTPIMEKYIENVTMLDYLAHNNRLTIIELNEEIDKLKQENTALKDAICSIDPLQSICQ